MFLGSLQLLLLLQLVSLCFGAAISTAKEESFHQIKKRYLLEWTVGAFSQCSVTCGGGVRVRSVRCLNDDGIITPEGSCDGDRPASYEFCNEIDCITHIPDANLIPSDGLFFFDDNKRVEFINTGIGSYTVVITIVESDSTTSTVTVKVTPLGTQTHIASRGKRQAQTQLALQVSYKSVFLILDNRETVQVSGGSSRFPIELGMSDTVTCDTGRREITSSSRVFRPQITNILECTFVEIDSTGTVQIVRAENGATRNYLGQGQLYIGSTQALFLNTSVAGALPSAIFNYIESNRQFFPRFIHPLEILFTRLPDNDLIVNLDNDGEDGNADSDDNTLVFTGSRCIQLDFTNFFVYANSIIQIRRHLEVQETILDINQLVHINHTSDQGVSCDDLIRSDGRVARSTIIDGPGLLCIGENALDLNDNLALFSNSESATRQIIYEGTGRQIEGAVNMGVALLTVGGDISSLAGQTLVTQTGAQSINFTGAGFIEKNQGRVQVFDSSQRLLRQFECTGGISFSRFTNNEIFISPQSDPDVARTAVEPNGLSVIFNPSMCQVFTYPQMNFAVREIAAENLARVPSV